MELKACNACGETKPLTEFYQNRRMSDGLLKQCKTCVKATQKTYRQVNREAVRERDHRWYEANRDRKRTYDAEYREANQDKLRAAKRQWHVASLDALKLAVFARYGQACACCGRTDRLTIDHIDGNGRQHREELFGDPSSGTKFYRWLVRNDFPEGFQTLCGPCNTSKRNGPECRLNHSIGHRL